MLRIGIDKVDALFVGQMGIKTASVGKDIVYQRPGAYVYIELQNSTTKETK